MIAKSTRISYYKEAFVKTEVACTVFSKKKKNASYVQMMMIKIDEVAIAHRKRKIEV